MTKSVGPTRRTNIASNPAMVMLISLSRRIPLSRPFTTDHVATMVMPAIRKTWMVGDCPIPKR